MSTEEDVALGRAVVADGRLRILRRTLGLTRSAMAELLHTSPVTYTGWESKPATHMWVQTAGRLGRFYARATEELALLRLAGVDVDKLMPVYLASTMLGLPQDLLLARYRDGEFEAEDLGILGLWVKRSDLRILRAGR